MKAQLPGISWQYYQSVNHSNNNIVELFSDGEQRTLFLVEPDQHKNFGELKGFTDNEMGLVCTDQYGTTLWFKRISVSTNNSEPFRSKIVANNDFILLHISSNSLQSIQYEGRNIRIDSSGNAFLFVSTTGELIDFTLLNSSQKSIEFKVSPISDDGVCLVAFYVNEPMNFNSISIDPMTGIHTISFEYNKESKTIKMKKPICIVETSKQYNFSFSTRTLYSDQNIDVIYLYEISDTIKLLSSSKSENQKVYNLRLPSKENPSIAFVLDKDKESITEVPLHFYLNDVKADLKGNIHLLTEFQTRFEDGWKDHSVYHVYTKDFEPLFKDTLFDSKTIFDVDHEGNAILVGMKDRKEKVVNRDTVLTIYNDMEMERISSQKTALPYKLNFKKINAKFVTDYEYSIDIVDKIAEYKTVKILRDGSISLNYFAKAKNMLFAKESKINPNSNEKFGYCTTIFKMSK